MIFLTVGSTLFLDFSYRLHQSEDVHVQSMIRYSHAMTYLMAYHNEKRIKTISIMLQARVLR